ncbi:MAG: apolipoprotein N-acyltransferase [Bacteroidetes bacterium]|nr:apolipoprotein N-acyltransferase [Bacteroidota bacterium]
MKIKHPIVLSLLSAFLLSISWLPYCTIFIFVAFVPLFFITEHYDSRHAIKRRKIKQFGLIFLSLLLWNLLTTWWVYNASPAAVLAFVLNALFMTWVFRLSVWFGRYVPKSLALFVIIPFWLSFEYLHQQWDLSWTWLNLGNVFAFQSSWVQWYEFTGVSGGTLWIWLINILVFSILKEKSIASAWNKSKLIKASCVLVFPVLISFVLFYTVDSRIKSSQLKAQNVLIVQPNIDPYNEKFTSDQQTQLDKLMRLVFEKDSSLIRQANYLVLPETFLTENVWEAELEQASAILFLKEKLLSVNPDLVIITGANTLQDYMANEYIPESAHKFRDGPGYYDFFNTGLQIDNSEHCQVYHKSKLVPGVEIMPFPWLLKPLEDYAIKLGGTFGSLGTQKERIAFLNKKNAIKVAPVICYESVYPEYVTGYIKNGANFIAIITNDGWWGETPGYKQHLAYGALRAIETRKPIVRSANTGVSCFINEQGVLSQQTPYWEEAVIQSTIYPNTFETFFVRFGDFLAKAALVAMLGIFVLGITKRFIKR